jgi:hypothetical protein
MPNLNKTQLYLKGVNIEVLFLRQLFIFEDGAPVGVALVEIVVKVESEPFSTPDSDSR